MNNNLKLPCPNSLYLLRMFQWTLNPVEYMDRAVAECGDTFILGQSGRNPSIMVSHPETMKTIFTDPSLGDCGELNELFRPLVGENSIFLLNGDFHKRRRKLLMPSFHEKHLVRYGEIISQITEQIIGQWEVNQPFSVMSMTEEISTSVILKVVFGIYQDDRYQRMKSLIRDRQRLIGLPLTYFLLNCPSLQQDWGSWSPWGRITDKIRQIDDLVYTVIRDRRAQANPEQVDMLGLLLNAHDENDQKLTDTELRDELMTLLSAGSSTTATAIAWALYWIHKLPQVKEKLLAELASLGSNRDPMTIVRLPYLSAVCNETMRIYPSLMLTFPRVVKSPLKIRGYQLDTGTSLIGSIYLTHQREDLYPQPKQFQPERFLNKQFSPFEFLPYGGGNRRCIGANLAEFEMKLVLAKIMTEWKLELLSENVKPKRRGFSLLGPSTSLKMTIKK